MSNLMITNLNRVDELSSTDVRQVVGGSFGTCYSGLIEGYNAVGDVLDDLGMHDEAGYYHGKASGLGQTACALPNPLPL